MGFENTYLVDSDQQISAAVIDALEDKTGVEHDELPTRLIDVIDPDSLNSLVGSEHQTDWQLTFTFGSLQITITNGEQIDITGSLADETLSAGH